MGCFSRSSFEIVGLLLLHVYACLLSLSAEIKHSLVVYANFDAAFAVVTRAKTNSTLQVRGTLLNLPATEEVSGDGN